MIEVLDRLHRWMRSIPFFLRFTLFTRILLAAGFVPTGLIKLLGRRFTTMPVETPIGAFFEAMYQTGLYWQFLGAGQVLAGLLLLAPRTAHLGAMLFLPIMANIFLITVSLGFGGTPFVTGPMLLAVIYLCAWDYRRFRGILTVSQAPTAPPDLRLDRLELVGFFVFAVSLMSFFLLSRGLAPGGTGFASIVLGLAAGLFTLLRFLTKGRRLRAEGVAA
jgi:hypothetical protein